MVKDIKIVFFGTPDFAIPVLKELVNNQYAVVGIFAANGPMEVVAKESGIQVFKPASLKKDEEAFKQFKDFNPDLCVIAAYGKIIPSRYLGVPKFGFLNIHPSLLPKYRGPSPVQTAILNGDSETGVSIMVVDEEVDHGPILASQEFSILNFKFSNHDQLAKELFSLGGKLLVEILPKYINGQVKPQEQDHRQATLTKMFSREDGRINWSKPSEEIYNQIRALNPEPGTWTLWQGKILNIREATTECEVGIRNNESEKELGKIYKINGDIAVATKTCYLTLKQIQLEGGKVMDARSFTNGHPDFLGSKLD